MIENSEVEPETPAVLEKEPESLKNIENNEPTELDSEKEEVF